MVPFIEDKGKWTYPADVMYSDEWPVRQASLVFAASALKRPEYLTLWKSLRPYNTKVEEVVRNYFIRQPSLWIDPH